VAGTHLSGPRASDPVRQVRLMALALIAALIVTFVAALTLRGSRHSFDGVYVAFLVATCLGVAAALVLVVWTRREVVGGRRRPTVVLALGLTFGGLALGGLASVMGVAADDGHPATFPAVVACVWQFLLVLTGALACCARRAPRAERQRACRATCNGMGHVTALELDARWLPTAHTFNIGREAREAIVSAQRVAAAHPLDRVIAESRVGRLQRLLTDR
jgi:hypothetical protein